MSKWRFFCLNKALDGGPDGSRRMMLPDNRNSGTGTRVGHNSFFIDDRKQILPVGGGSRLESKLVRL